MKGMVKCGMMCYRTGGQIDMEQTVFKLRMKGRNDAASDEWSCSGTIVKRVACGE